ncbi:hypothetical protein ADIARSV_1211 [Arcticibacter svalbardensis MN12-7]|uniref:KTSC domain-containing protein n=1 Tax=Arcticibacter svalbardensis MN12-7 TaxID=1150600 RepID=R9GVR5_9SPHI|nr:hypothetical protein [Arcticibacter svalbardensis]EOR95605.1 hypothetical protein ADIARSV_1211 [Arcticibacter svalbardensis MN12-7]
MAIRKFSTYEIGITYILVGFTKGGVYEYNYAIAGEINIETMKSYALAGSGLYRFIQRHAKYKYSRRIT